MLCILYHTFKKKPPKIKQQPKKRYIYLCSEETDDTIKTNQVDLPSGHVGTTKTNGSEAVSTPRHVSCRVGPELCSELPFTAVGSFRRPARERGWGMTPQPPFHSSLLTACRVPHGHPTWKLENTRTADRVPLAENRVGKQWNRRERQSRFCKGYMLHNGEHVKTLLNDNSELQTQKSNMICMVGGEKTAEHVHSTSKCRQESKGTYTKLITDIWSRDDRKSKDFRMISNVSKIFKKNAHVPLAWFNIKSMSKYNHLICFYKIEMPVALAKLS